MYLLWSETWGVLYSNNDIKDFVREMKDTLTHNIDKTLLLIKVRLKETSPKFNQIIQIIAYYNYLKNKYVSETSKEIDIETGSSKVVSRLTKFLDTLKTMI